MQWKIQTLYNNTACRHSASILINHFYQLFPTDSEYGLHDGIFVKVNTPADLRTISVFSSWKRKCICLCFLQLLQHQVGGAVPGNHSSGVSFCHHLQLPEQGANCFKLELQTALNKTKHNKRHIFFLCCRLMSPLVRESCFLCVWSCSSVPSPSVLSSLSDTWV